MEYHVAKTGCNTNPGTKDNPFLTISKAAELAQPGDTVIVHEGVYREWVKPKFSGANDKMRITYRAAEGEEVIIKGSEVVDNWVKVGKLWICEISNSFFCDGNPFAEEIWGDWLLRPLRPNLHTGAVYLDGAPLAEQPEKENVSGTEMAYFAEVTEEKTTIYANFGKKNPQDALVEFHARKYCFAPTRTHINYITVSGFTMCHAATNWAPPTASQDGMIWARWCKGWVIENNTLHHSRCSAISLGRDGELGDNATVTNHKKPGFREQLEIVFRSVQAGWSKETIGSHIVRNNHIFDCGQAGVVGHMGCAFSEVYGNHIHHIADKEEFMGWEIGGIKFHAAIDTYIHHNCIHHCHRGLWLDWQAQGVRVSSNLFFENNGAEDLFIEVSHGPCFVDNNILNSKVSLRNVAQGNAYIHNWFGGALLVFEERRRYTPYHFAHSTDVLGTAIIATADERFYQNVFCTQGLDYFNGCPDNMEEYMEQVLAPYYERASMDVDAYWNLHQPVYIDRNLYAGGAKPYDKEKNYTAVETEAKLAISEENGVFYAEASMPDADIPCILMHSHELPVPRMTEQLFETANGENIVLDTDIAGNSLKDKILPGPLQKKGKTIVFKM